MERKGKKKREQEIRREKKREKERERERKKEKKEREKRADLQEKSISTLQPYKSSQDHCEPIKPHIF